MTEHARNLLPRMVFTAGQVIFQQGEKGDHAYVVESGEIEIARHQSGKRKVLGTIKKGGVFGEMALIDGEPRMADAVALSEVTCLVVHRAEFLKKFDASDPFMKAMVRIFVRNIRSMAEAT